MARERSDRDELFAPITVARASSAIAEQIRAAIVGGRLSPGERLAPERELAEQFGVSRVTVRDALRSLEAMGLIDVRVGARGGAFVTAPAPRLVGEGIADMLRLADVTPAEVTETRLVFEQSLLPLVCERAAGEDLAALEEICERAETAYAAGAYDVALSAEFHTRLAACAHNTAIALFAEMLHGPLVRSLHEAKLADPAAGAAGLLEHRALLEAVRARDVAAAQRIMAEHVGRTARRVAS